MSNDKLILKMTDYFSGDAKRIQHFLKVYAFASLIGRQESLDTETLKMLETAAIVHDIGIKPAEEKYGSASGKLQEKEGPAEAEKMLLSLAYDEKTVNRVCYLVGHHHTYDNIDGADYRILVEADFLVNLFEDGASASAVERVYNSVFKTESGKKICRSMFGINS